MSTFSADPRDQLIEKLEQRLMNISAAAHSILQNAGDELVVRAQASAVRVMVGNGLADIETARAHQVRS